MVKNNFKSLVMGILIISTTIFLMTNNTNATVFAQSGNNIVGCAHTVKVTISGLLKQKADATTQVTLSNTNPNNDHGQANIIIPGIGIGLLTVIYHQSDSKIYTASVGNLPGQTGPSEPANQIANYVCYSSHNASPANINIPGIGFGTLDMVKVN